MVEEFAQLGADSRERTITGEDWHRKNMEEIRTSVTRGAAGIEASYFADQSLHLNLANTSDHWEGS